MNHNIRKDSSGSLYIWMEPELKDHLEVYECRAGIAFITHTYEGQHIPIGLSIDQAVVLRDHITEIIERRVSEAR